MTRTHKRRIIIGWALWGSAICVCLAALVTGWDAPGWTAIPIIAVGLAGLAIAADITR